MDATLNRQHVGNHVWDVVVVGAGIAGATAAIGLSRLGLRVLLVDRKAFPRDKVCGACLNGDAVAGLKSLGVLDRMMQAGALPLERYQLRSGSQNVTLKLPSGLSISRRAMDQILVEEAITAGCEFLPEVTLHLNNATQQHVEPLAQHLDLSDPSGALRVRGRIVILATGLASDHLVDQPGLQLTTKADSRVGFGVSATQFPDEYAEGTIYMAVADDGYVGASRTEHGQLNIAAAIDREALRGTSAAEVCGSILSEAGFPVCAGMLSGRWRGTTTLTRRRQNVAGHRLFVVGDAAGYIEPFTGEGMAWAIRGGRAIVPLVAAAANHWDSDYADQWGRVTQDLITTQQWWCHTFAHTLRYPKLVRGLLRVVTLVPALGQIVVRQINRERKHDMFDRRSGDRASTGSC